jgi:hypothetical protein
MKAKLLIHLCQTKRKKMSGIPDKARDTVLLGDVFRTSVIEPVHTFAADVPLGAL